MKPRPKEMKKGHTLIVAEGITVNYKEVLKSMVLE